MPNWKKVIVSGSDAVLNNLNVAGALTASGLLYPGTDGTSGQVLQTDGLGNLSFVDGASENVTTTVKNVSGTALRKGTPVHAVSASSSGNINPVIAASASVASTMPATFILGEDLDDQAEGEGIAVGSITGVNTSAFEVGDIVYVGVSGGYTNVKPTGSANLIQNLGVVTKVHPSNGAGFIYGSGRSNDVPNLPKGKIWVGSDNYSVTSSVVYLDENNGRVGIGTTLPSAKLEIADSNYVDLLNLNRSGVNSVAFRVGNVGSGDVALDVRLPSLNSRVGIRGAMSIGADYADGANTGITNGLVVQGNVGIGTTNPGQKLEVLSGSISISGPNVAGNSYRLNDTGGTSRNAMYVNSSNQLELGNINYAGGVKLVGDVNVSGILTADEFHTTFVSASIIYQSGSTKFGDTLDDTHSFTGSLNITGSVLLDDTSRIKLGDDQDLQIYHSGTHGFINGSSGAGSLYLRPGAGGTIQLETQASADMATFSSTSIRLYIGGAEKMIVNSAGNVGIGIDSPSAKLHVSGANATNIAYLEAPRARFKFYTDSTSTYTTTFGMDDTGLDIGHDSSLRSINLRTNNQDRLTVLGNGNVGIGTTTPTAKLHISASGNGTNTSLVVEDEVRKIKIGRDTINAYTKADVATQLYLNSNSNVSINATSGNTVIGGTSVPSNAKLAVVGNISASGDMYADGKVVATSFTGSFLGNLDGNAATATTAISASNALNIKVSDIDTAGTYYPMFADATSGFARANVDASTFTYNPSTDTLVVGIISGSVFSGSFYGDGSGLQDVTATVSLAQVLGTGNDAASNDIENVGVLSATGLNATGTIGVGPTPNTSLGRLVVSQSAGTQVSGLSLTSDDGNAYMYMSGSSSRLAIQSGFTGGASILLNPDGTGNVGINTPSPSYGLHVNTDAYVNDLAISSAGDLTFLGNALIQTNNNSFILNADSNANGSGFISLKASNVERVKVTTSGAEVTGDLTVTGIVTAQEFHTEFVSASILYSSGSTKFGDTSDDLHQFTGSVYINNAGSATELFRAQRASTYRFVLDDYARVDHAVNGAVYAQTVRNTSATATSGLLRLGHSGTGAHITTYGTNESLIIDPDGSGGVKITGSLEVSSGITGSLQGNATTATTTENSATASNALNIRVSDIDTAGTYYPMFADAASGFARANVDASTFTYNPSTDTLVVGIISGSIVRAASSASFGGPVMLRDGDSSNLALNFSSSANTGLYIYNYDASSKNLSIRVNGTNIGTFGPPGISSNANVYTSDTGQFRNYGGVWKATTGTAGGDAQFILNGKTIMHLDEADERVGIGNTAPGTKLHVGVGSSATVDTGYQLAVDSAGIAGIQILAATNQSSRVVFGDSDDNDVGMLRYDHTDNSMRFVVNGSSSERMRITSTGNVGIGVIPKTGGSTWQHIQFGGTGNIIGRISDSTVDAMFANNYYVNSSNVDSHIITGAATRMFLNDGEIRFDTAPSAAADAAAVFTNRLFIANTGNVGIGTTTPSAELTVQGSIHISSSLPQLRFSDLQQEDWQISNDNGDFRFTQLDDNITAMYISSSGNVGIGTTSPSKTLHVNGTFQASGEAFFSHFDNTTNNSRFRDDLYLNFGTNRIFRIGYNSTSDKLQFGSGSNALMTLDGDGNLVVEGSITAQEFHTEFVSASIIYQSGSTKFGDTVDDIHDFTGRVQIDTSGSNKTGQNSALMLLSTNNDTSIRLGQSVNYGFEIKYKGTDGGNDNDLEFLSDGTTYNSEGGITWMNTKQDGTMEIGVNRPLYIPGSGSAYNGNVGIGTTAPDVKLHVGPSSLTANYDTNATTLAISDVGNGAQLILRGLSPKLLFDASGGGNGEIYLDNSHLDILSGTPASPGNSHLFVSSSGKIGVGTTTPDELFDVAGWMRSENLTVESTAYVGAGLAHWGDGDTNITFADDQMILNAGGVEFIRLYEASGDTLVINEGGVDVDLRVEGDTDINLIRTDAANDRVGIGIGTPTEKLHVSGTLAITDTATVRQTAKVQAGDPSGVTLESFDTTTLFGAFVDYVVYDASKENMRAGTIQMVFNEGGGVQHTDNSTSDIGNTSGAYFDSTSTGAAARLWYYSDSTDWSVRYHIRYL